jgi:hypothetical protein
MGGSRTAHTTYRESIAETKALSVRHASRCHPCARSVSSPIRPVRTRLELDGLRGVSKAESRALIGEAGGVVRMRIGRRGGSLGPWGACS